MCIPAPRLVDGRRWLYFCFPVLLRRNADGICLFVLPDYVFFTALASESCLEAQLQNKPPAGTMQIS
jgi:hypothetical protein